MLRGLAIDALKVYAADNSIPDTITDEYIDEAEHQDGEEYWDMFDSEALLLNDFALYNIMTMDQRNPDGSLILE